MYKFVRVLYVALVYIISLPVTIMFFLFMTCHAMCIAIRDGEDDKIGYFKDLLVNGVFEGIKEGCRAAYRNTVAYVKHDDY